MSILRALRVALAAMVLIAVMYILAAVAWAVERLARAVPHPAMWEAAWFVMVVALMLALAAVAVFAIELAAAQLASDPPPRPW